MNTKPLIVGSICAVILVVLCSLSHVVGYQSMQSNSNTESPLFNVRTQRATHQQQNLLTSQYLGKEKENLLRFLGRNNRNDELLKKVIEIINKMDTKTFKRFIEVCTKKIEQDNTINIINLDEISQAFYQVGEILEEDVDIGNSKNNLLQTDTSYIRTCGGLSICYDWSPGCILKSIILRIISYLVDIFQWSTVGWLCYPTNNIPCQII